MLLTILLTNKAPTAIPLAFTIADAAEVASLTTLANNCALPWASTVKFPPALIIESSMKAFTSAGCSPPMSVPIRVSIIWNKMFCAANPMVLKAIVAPTAVSPDVVRLSTFASIKDVFCASTSKSPVVVILLPRIKALALLRTRLVAITPFAASEVPSPKELPPDDSTTLSTCERMTASLKAVTPRDAATTVESITALST